MSLWIETTIVISFLLLFIKYKAVAVKLDELLELCDIQSHVGLIYGNSEAWCLSKHTEQQNEASESREWVFRILGRIAQSNMPKQNHLRKITRSNPSQGEENLLPY